MTFCRAGKTQGPCKILVRLPEQSGGRLCPLTPAGPLSLPRAAPPPYTLTTRPQTGPTPISPKESRPGFPLRREEGRGSRQITPEIRSPRKQGTGTGWLASPCPRQDQQHLTRPHRGLSDPSASPGATQAAGDGTRPSSARWPSSPSATRCGPCPGDTHTGPKLPPLHALAPGSCHAAASGLRPDGFFISATRSRREASDGSLAPAPRLEGRDQIRALSSETVGPFGPGPVSPSRPSLIGIAASGDPCALNQA